MTVRLGAFGTAFALAALVVAVLFLRGRNQEFMSRELGAARAAAEAQVELVSKPQASRKYAFLRRRTLGGQPLADKLLADAATRAETTGPFAHFLDDGTGRIVAAIPHADGTAVVVTRPGTPPASLPWLLLAATLLGGGLLAAAIRPPAARGIALAPLGIVAAWIAPPAAWVCAGLALLLGFAESRGLPARMAAALGRHRVAYAFVLPAALAMTVLVVTPFLVGLALGFYDHNRGEWHFVGLDNFAAILGAEGRGLTDPLNFWFTLAVTLGWTVVNVALHVAIGVTLALALRQPWLRLRGLWRSLLILPWAVPNYITALIWRGMFHEQFGAINGLLKWFGIPEVSWFSHFASAFAANVTTNTWLGFPFMMIVALGALESIPRDLYEAAAVDGASPWARFRHITLPSLRPALGPAVVLGSIWTFNMFNVIYLVSAGKPVGSTDILITQAYRWAFERGQRYGMAAAYATLIFLILALFFALRRRRPT